MSAPLILYSGPAGIGKTHHLHALIQTELCSGNCEVFSVDPGPDAMRQVLNRLAASDGGYCLVLDDLQKLGKSTSNVLLEWIDTFEHDLLDGIGTPFRLLMATRPFAATQTSVSHVDWVSRLQLLPFVEHRPLSQMKLSETVQMLEVLAEAGGFELASSEITAIALWVQERSSGHPFVSRLLFEEWMRSGYQLKDVDIPKLVTQHLAASNKDHSRLDELGHILQACHSPMPNDILAKALEITEQEVLSLAGDWLDRGIVELDSAGKRLGFAHDLYREHFSNNLSNRSRSLVLARVAQALPHSEHALRCSLIFSIVLQEGSSSDHLLQALELWQKAEPASAELEELAFRVLENPELPVDLLTLARGQLLEQCSYQKQRQRWLELLEKEQWGALERDQASRMVFTLVPTLDHTGQLQRLSYWLKRLESEIDQDLIATIRLDFAMNRVLRNDQKSIRPIFDSDELRSAFQTDNGLRENRLAQIKLVELFLSHNIIADPSGWLQVLEEYYTNHGQHLDPWSHDRLVTQIVDSAGRARDGRALQRWLEPAIASAEEVAKVEPAIFGRARVARRKLHFGMAGDCMEDLLAAASWQLVRGNLRMALPDLDAAATSHYKHGRITEACEILREVEGLVLAAPHEFLTIAFRINASAPFLASGDWITAMQWLSGLQDALVDYPQIKPSWEYAMIQVLDRKAMGVPLSEDEFEFLEQMATEQLAISPAGSQRAAELNVVLWVNSVRRGRPGPTCEECDTLLSDLEEHNIQPRPQAVSQLAELALISSVNSPNDDWSRLARKMEDRLQRESSSGDVLFHLQLARIARMKKLRTESRGFLFEACLTAWERRSQSWLHELHRLFPRARMEGLSRDSSRDEMLPGARIKWLQLLEQQCLPGPRFKAFGIDLSHANVPELLEKQLKLISKRIRKWRKQSTTSTDLDRLEQAALRVGRQLPELNDAYQRQKQQVGLRVELLGRVTIYGHGRELSTMRLGNGLFRELFAFLVIERWRHPGRAWPAHELIARIWRRGDRMSDQLLNSFYVYMSHIRALLKSTGFPGCLEHVREGYRIHVDCPVELDLEDFAREVEQMRATHFPLNVEAILAYLAEYGRPIDLALSGKWLDQLRAWHEQKWFSIAERLGRVEMSAGQQKRLAILTDSFYPD